ncbi:MAG: hypothetical protein PHT33_13095 [bacterium]|nr:hypothetical protein [bacterium]
MRRSIGYVMTLAVAAMVLSACSVTAATCKDILAAGKGMIQAGDYAGAKAQALEARKLAGTAQERNEAELLLARALLALKDYTGAVQALEELKRADPLHSSEKKAYQCRFLPQTPVSAEGWTLSDFIRDAQNREARFEPYSKESAYLLAATDVAAERSTQDSAKASSSKGTAFFMASDPNGWHIYVQSDDPNVRQIAADGGTGAGTLEMYFSPGRGGEAYYQWVIPLATGAVSFYDWNSPYTGYRPLRDRPGAFRTDTVVLDKGWGTAVFIPWECLYDKLPFVEGNDDTWRFSMIRWTPGNNLTWGGRVHETGRWGYIRFQPPAKEQRLDIMRQIIRTAWRRCRTVKAEQAAYWSGACGDMDFYKSCIEPLLNADREYAEKIKTLDAWDENTVIEVYKNRVCDWMEMSYGVAQLRSQYLTQKHLQVK